MCCGPNSTGVDRSRRRMLAELHIGQFALIDKLHLSFADGMTVFSGETGAGKSVLVDALGAAFGCRAKAEWVRHGADHAEVSAVLNTPGKALRTLLTGHDIDTNDDDIILRRIISSEGRSKAYVNGTPVPIKLLQHIGDICLDLHGQHEHQALLNPDYQRDLLDARLPANLFHNTQQAYEKWKQAQKALSQFQLEKNDASGQLDWLKAELSRLQEVAPEEGLADQLHAEVEAGRHFAQIQEMAANALAILDESDSSVRSKLAQASRSIAQVSEFRPELGECSEMLTQTEALLGEITSGLANIMDEDFDAQALAQAEQRFMDLHDAMRRHGVDETGLAKLMEEMHDKLSRLDTAGWDEAELQKNLASAREEYRQTAIELNHARKHTSVELTRELRPFLDKLALSGMRIEIAITPRESDDGQWTSHGWDEISFMASSNPGEPFRALSAVASGGELSRFVLALKGCGSLKSAPDVAVFDEVDTGIGGETAWCVGELLAAMAKERQVLVVSHLAQVAACADWQKFIHKQLHEGRTIISVENVEAGHRQDELARMLGGINDQSRVHATDMLERGQACRASRPITVI